MKRYMRALFLFLAIGETFVFVGCLTCLSCDNLQEYHHDSCRNYTVCPLDEVCYHDILVDDDGSTFHRRGCKNITSCLEPALIGKRANPSIICSACCNLNNCETTTCQNTATPSATHSSTTLALTSPRTTPSTIQSSTSSVETSPSGIPTKSPATPSATHSSTTLALTSPRSTPSTIQSSTSSVETSPSGIPTKSPDTHTHQAPSTPCRNSDYTYNPETGTCFKIYDTWTTFQANARSWCQLEYADLLILKNGTEENVFRNMQFNVSDHNTMKRYWLGAVRRSPLQYKHGAADFCWINGRDLDPTLRWFPGQPNNAGGKENCLSFSYSQIDAELVLNDEDCSQELYYICEEKCPNNSYTFSPPDLCYKMFHDHVTWNEAKSRCEQDNMDLIEFRDSSNLQYFQNLLKGNETYWVGARDTGSNGSFDWLTLKERVPASLWHTGMPLPVQEGKHCIALSHSLADTRTALTNIDCNSSMHVNGYICQRIW